MFGSGSTTILIIVQRRRRRIKRYSILNTTHGWIMSATLQAHILSAIPVWLYSVRYTRYVGFPECSHFVCLLPRIVESVRDVLVPHELPDHHKSFNFIPNIGVLVFWYHLILFYIGITILCYIGIQLLKYYLVSRHLIISRIKKTPFNYYNIQVSVSVYNMIICAYIIVSVSIYKFQWLCVIYYAWVPYLQLYEYIIAVSVHFVERKYKTKTILIADDCFYASYA